MAKINLLPWREELRKKKQRDFAGGIVAGMLATGGALFGVYLHIEGMKEYQVSRNQILKNEIAILDQRIQEIKDIEEKKNKLLNKIDLIQKLQESRPEIVHMFDEMSKVTPEGVFLNKLTQLCAQLTLDGKAESNARVSAYMRAVDNSQWLNGAALSVIKGEGKTNGAMNDFTMTAKLGKSGDKTQAGAVK